MITWSLMIRAKSKPASIINMMQQLVNAMHTIESKGKLAIWYLLIMIASASSVCFLEYMRHTFLVPMMYWSCMSRVFNRLASKSKGIPTRQKMGSFMIEACIMLLFAKYLTMSVILATYADVFIIIIRYTRRLSTLDSLQRIKAAGKLYYVTQYVFTPTQLHLWCVRLIRQGPRKHTLLSVQKALQVCRGELTCISFPGKSPFTCQEYTNYGRACLSGMFIAYTLHFMHNMIMLSLLSRDGATLVLMILLSRRHKFRSTR